MIWTILQAILLGLPLLWLLADLYICYRWVRKPQVDFTAGVLWYWTTKWMMVTQSGLIADRLGYPGKDLSEVLLNHEDGDVS